MGIPIDERSLPFPLFSTSRKSNLHVEPNFAPTPSAPPLSIYQSIHPSIYAPQPNPNLSSNFLCPYTPSSHQPSKIQSTPPPCLPTTAGATQHPSSKLNLTWKKITLWYCGIISAIFAEASVSNTLAVARPTYLLASLIQGCARICPSRGLWNGAGGRRVAWMEK